MKSNKFESLSVNELNSLGQNKTNFIKLGSNLSSGFSSKLSGAYFGTGSAYTSGNIIRNFYDLYSHYPLIYTPTVRDIEIAEKISRTLFQEFPILNEFPWLYPYNSEIYPTIVELSKTRPLYNVAGMGLGNVEIYKNGNSTSGIIKNMIPSYNDFYYGPFRKGSNGLIPELRNINESIYPYSGLLYSGNLVQYKFENGNVKVVPYQAGRGVPQYDSTKPYYSGNPFGNPVIESYTIEPFLSSGVTPGNNDFCLGVSQMSQIDSKICMLSTYENITGIKPSDNLMMPPEYHPAPFTAPPVIPNNRNSSNYNRLISPGPNLSGGNWAPWPAYYAYQENQDVPVLTKGKASLRIGAATNIALMCYYEPEIEPGDNPVGNPNYVPVQIVPLFQGEKVKVGSDIFASHLGTIINYRHDGMNPYPVASFLNVTGTNIIENSSGADVISNGIQRDARAENPWWDNYDPTFGNNGWTSTPGFSLAGIPDMGQSIADSKINPLDFLIQSNQGSCIVTASTTVDTFSENGSGRNLLLCGEDYTTNNVKFQRITKLPNSSQNANRVGSSLQEIEGTGKWEYTGSFSVDTTNLISGIYYGQYVDGFINTELVTGSGRGCVMFLENFSSVYSITGSSLIISNGEGYAEGDILRLTNGLNDKFPEGSSPNFIGNSSFVTYTEGGPFVNAPVYLNGYNYRSEHGVMGYNVTRNSVYVELNVIYSENFSATPNIRFPGKVVDITVLNLDDTSFPSGISNYFTPGTLFIAMNLNNARQFDRNSSSVVFEVLTNDGTNITAGIYNNFVGESFSYYIGTNLYCVQQLDKNSPMELSITVDENTAISDIKITDWGYNNLPGDAILIIQKDSSNNCIFVIQNDISEINIGFEFIEGGAGYINRQQYNYNYATNSNQLEMTDTSDTLNGKQIIMTGTTIDGSINNVNWTRTDFVPLGEDPEQYPDFSNFIGVFNQDNKLQQTIPFVYDNQPAVATMPDGGWPSFAIRNTATIEFPPDIKILINGDNYIINEIYETNSLNGTGTGMQIRVTEINSSLGIVSAIIENQGSGYVFNERLEILNASATENSILVLLYQPTNSVQYFLTETETFDLLPLSIYQFDYEVIQKGSGYSAGNTLISVSCANRSGENMTVKVKAVDGDGGVLQIEIIENGQLAYKVGNIINLISGNNDCFVKLLKPRKPNKIEFNKRGNNYTTETNVPLMGITNNNLIVLCDLTGGGCVPYDYDGSHTIPYFWDLTLYEVGDQLRFNQDGNISAVYEIVTLDSAQGIITFTEISAGVGYDDSLGTDAAIQTEKIYDTITTVDITTNSDGNVETVSLNTLGDDIFPGYKYIINQETSSKNCVVRINALRDVPPMWENDLNGRNPESTQWNNYNAIMKSAVNLFDYQIVTDIKMSHPEFMNKSWYTAGNGGLKYEPCRGQIPGCNLL